MCGKNLNVNLLMKFNSSTDSVFKNAWEPRTVDVECLHLGWPERCSSSSDFDSSLLTQEQTWRRLAGGNEQKKSSVFLCILSFFPSLKLWVPGGHVVYLGWTLSSAWKAVLQMSAVESLDKTLSGDVSEFNLCVTWSSS